MQKNIGYLRLKCILCIGIFIHTLIYMDCIPDKLQLSIDLKPVKLIHT